MTDNKMKKTIRLEALQKRDALPRDIKSEKDIAIMQRVIQLPEFKNAKTILFYASFRSEVDTLDMIKLSLSMGKSVVLPKVDKENGMLHLYEIKSMDEMVRGYMWIFEPDVSDDRLKKLEDIELVIIPGAAFDTYGNRLGYGAGFYDKLLSSIKGEVLTIAPAYEEQIVDRIPSEPHDVRIGKIITDKRIIECIK